MHARAQPSRRPRTPQRMHAAAMGSENNVLRATEAGRATYAQCRPGEIRGRRPEHIILSRRPSSIHRVIALRAACAPRRADDTRSRGGSLPPCALTVTSLDVSMAVFAALVQANE